MRWHTACIDCSVTPDPGTTNFWLALIGLQVFYLRLGVLREVTGGARNLVFEYAPYIEIFGELRP